jgi:16S rRNA (guanine527-N7)-methyltransferase
MPGFVETEVVRLAEKWRVKLTDGAADRIAIYVSRLMTWNEKVNLTGARHASEVVGDHLPDSFVLASLCPSDCSLVDIGSGGGLPAVPFAILRPDCRVALVEPRAKRVAFLKLVVRDCGCGSVQVLRQRVEQVPCASFSVAASRATFDPEEWLGIGTGLVCVGGTVVVFGTAPISIAPSGLQLRESVEYSTARGSARWAGCYCST